MKPSGFAPPSWSRDLVEPAIDVPCAIPARIPYEKVWSPLVEASAAWRRASSAESTGPDDESAMRWVDDHPMITEEARALGERVQKRLAKKGAPKAWEPEVEAAMYTLLARRRGKSEEVVPQRILFHWASRVGPEEALRTFFRTQAIRTYPQRVGGQALFFLFSDPPDYPLSSRELRALRRMVRAFGLDALEATLRAAFSPRSPRQRAELAWLLDDQRAADALHAEALEARAGDDGDTLRELAILVGLVSDVEAAAALTPDLTQPGRKFRDLERTHGREYALRVYGDCFSDPSPEGGGYLRAAFRHGEAYGPTVISRARQRPEDWIAVLPCFPSLDGARLLVPLLAKKSLRKEVVRALLAMPADAPVALTEALAHPPEHADALESLLAELAPK